MEMTSITDSILTSIKKLLGSSEEITAFDPDIIMHINSVFLSLHQLGVGPDEGFFIDDAVPTWSDYVSDKLLGNSVKAYVYLNVKLVFDPPANSYAIDSINKLINKHEWRIKEYVETKNKRRGEDHI